jgi:hypothetical protein
VRTGIAQAVGLLATPRSMHSATTVYQDAILVAGGLDSDSGALASCELFNGTTLLWSATGSLHVPRYYHSATRLTHGNVLVIGGFGTGASTTAELYTEATSNWTSADGPGVQRIGHTATLLPDGRVLVAGVVNLSNVSRARGMRVVRPGYGNRVTGNRGKYSDNMLFHRYII